MINKNSGCENTAHCAESGWASKGFSSGGIHIIRKTYFIGLSIPANKWKDHKIPVQGLGTDSLKEGLVLGGIIRNRKT